MIQSKKYNGQLNTQCRNINKIEVVRLCKGIDRKDRKRNFESEKKWIVYSNSDICMD